VRWDCLICCLGALLRVVGWPNQYSKVKIHGIDFHHQEINDYVSKNSS
jgi:hypothetical protein